MYKIQYFDRKLFGGNLQCFGSDDGYSIWPWRHWEMLREFLPCRPEWFPLMYWLALTISVWGFFFSCSEFLSIYYGSWTLSTFRERKFRVIPLVFRRNVRLMTAALMTKIWAGLCFGIVTATPSAITSWLTMYFGVFCPELILWIGEILFGVIKLDARAVWSHCASFGTFLVMRCVRDVFHLVIEHQGNIHELELLPSLAH